MEYQVDQADSATDIRVDANTDNDDKMATLMGPCEIQEWLNPLENSAS